jgi:O-antigen/teichoic acid export membrane protein
VNNLISFSLIAGLTIVGLYLFPDNLIGPIGGRLLAAVISGGWVLGMIYYQFGFHFNFKLIKSTFGFAHPSLIYQIMQWFNNSYDRVVLSNFLPLAQVGMYDLAAKCLTAIELTLSGFYNSFFPKVVGIVALQTEKKTSTEINRYFNGLTAVTILLVCFSILLFPPVIRLISLKPGFLSAIEWIPFIAVTYLLRSLRYYLAMPYGTTKYSKPLPFFYVIIAAAKITGMVVLIPRYGIMGLIIATWIGYMVEALILYFGIKNRFEINFNVYKLIIAPLILGVIIIIVEPLFGKKFEVASHLVYLVIGGFVLTVAYRNELKVFDWGSVLKNLKKSYIKDTLK